MSRWFLPSVRRGVASALPQADPWTEPPAVSLEPEITLVESVAGTKITATPSPALQLLGPDSVVALGPDAVLRRDPPPDATDAEESMLASIELAPADLPWMFTPVAADGQGRVRPWLVLIVVQQSTSTLTPGVPSTVTVPVGELPDLSDSHAWAHVQVMLDSSPVPDTAEQAATAAAALGSEVTARILCLRRLESATAYIACLVPAFLGGVQAGLGELVDGTTVLQPAWTPGANAMVTLPVYDSWSFTTSATVDFPQLAGRIQPLGSTLDGFGTRPIDVSRPFLDSPASGPETIALGGALRLGDEPPESWDGQEAFLERLGSMLDDPAQWRGAPVPAGTDVPPFTPTPPRRHPRPPPPPPDPGPYPTARPESSRPADEDPPPATSTPSPSPSPPQALAPPSLGTGAVAPPIYGARFSGADYVPSNDVSWLYQLNMSARYRTIAGLGVRYVQEHRDFLISEAWAQLGDVRTAEQQRRRTELAAEVGDTVWNKHVAPRGPAQLLGYAGAARNRVPVDSASGDRATLLKWISDQDGPVTVLTPTFGGAVRPYGPLGRRLFNARYPQTALQAAQGAITITPIDPQVTVPIGDLNRSSLWLPNNPDQPPGGLIIDTVGSGDGLPLRPPWGGEVNRVPILPMFAGVATEADVTRQTTAATPLPAEFVTAFMPSGGALRRYQDRFRGRAPASLAPIRQAPSFPAPIGAALMAEHPDDIMPGLGSFPQNSVALLHTDPSFIEAFLVGANDELNRELLWNGYPTDSTGTAFARFWPTSAANPDDDVVPIAQWTADSSLGTHAPGGGGGESTTANSQGTDVLIVRGDLLRAYPGLPLFAVAAAGNEPSSQASDWYPPSLVIRLGPDASLFSFPISITDAADTYFVFQEPTHGCRFALRGLGGSGEFPYTYWSDVGWESSPCVPHQANGAYASIQGSLAPPAKPDIAGTPATWGCAATSVDVARIAYEEPYRIAFRGTALVPQVVS